MCSKIGIVKVALQCWKRLATSHKTHCRCALADAMITTPLIGRPEEIHSSFRHDNGLSLYLSGSDLICRGRVKLVIPEGSHLPLWSTLQAQHCHRRGDSVPCHRAMRACCAAGQNLMLRLAAAYVLLGELHLLLQRRGDEALLSLRLTAKPGPAAKDASALKLVLDLRLTPGWGLLS